MGVRRTEYRRSFVKTPLKELSRDYEGKFNYRLQRRETEHRHTPFEWDYSSSDDEDEYLCEEQARLRLKADDERAPKSRNGAQRVPKSNHHHHHHRDDEHEGKIVNDGKAKDNGNLRNGRHKHEANVCVCEEEKERKPKTEGMLFAYSAVEEFLT